MSALSDPASPLSPRKTTSPGTNEMNDLESCSSVATRSLPLSFGGSRCPRNRRRPRPPTLRPSDREDSTPLARFSISPHSCLRFEAFPHCPFQASRSIRTPLPVTPQPTGSFLRRERRGLSPQGRHPLEAYGTRPPSPSIGVLSRFCLDFAASFRPTEQAGDEFRRWWFAAGMNKRDFSGFVGARGVGSAQRCSRVRAARSPGLRPAMIFQEQARP